jgi:hypothetical protein
MTRRESRGWPDTAVFPGPHRSAHGPGKPTRVWIAFTGDQHYALRLIRFRGNIPLSKTVYLLQGLEVASSAQSTCA